jgi:hypothetical protein
MRTRFFLILLAVLALGSCDHPGLAVQNDGQVDGQADGQVDAGAPTAQTCEPITDPALCRAAGCTQASAYRSIMEEGKCVAATLRPVCIAVGETSNNAISTHCREPEDGGVEFVWFGEAVPVDGWEYCDYWEYLCGVSSNVCEAQTDCATCEDRYCHWAEAARIGVIEDGLCVGWESQPVGMCLKPRPFLTFLDGVSTFLTGDLEETAFSMETASGARRVLGIRVNATADFASDATGSWRRCRPYDQEPTCGCP